MKRNSGMQELRNLGIYGKRDNNSQSLNPSIHNSSLFYRHIDIPEEERVIDTETREAVLTFSSEQPVIRWFGSEILLHGKDNIDFRRLRSVGALIYGHQPDQLKNILGPVRKVWLEDRKGKARVAFDDDEAGNLAMQKAKSGSLRGVSFGYMIDKARQLEEREEWTDQETNVTYRGPALIATRWTPYEISLTPVPADATVGVGRDMTRSLDGIELTTNNKENTTMERNEIVDLIRAEIKPIAAEIVAEVRAGIAEAARPKFAVTAEEWQDIYGRSAAVSPEAQIEMASMLAQGKTANEMQRKLLDLAVKAPDARDQGNGPGAEGTGMQTSETNGQQAVIRSFKQITDDEFFAGLTNPAAFAVN